MVEFIAAHPELAPQSLTNKLAVLKESDDLAAQRWAMEQVFKLMDVYPRSRIDVGVEGTVRMEHAPDYSLAGLTREQLAEMAQISLENEDTYAYADAIRGRVGGIPFVRAVDYPHQPRSLPALEEDPNDGPNDPIGSSSAT